MMILQLVSMGIVTKEMMVSAMVRWNTRQCTFVRLCRSCLGLKLHELLSNSSIIITVCFEVRFAFVQLCNCSSKYLFIHILRATPYPIGQLSAQNIFCCKFENTSDCGRYLKTRIILFFSWILICILCLQSTCPKTFTQASEYFCVPEYLNLSIFSFPNLQARGFHQKLLEHGSGEMFEMM